MTESVELTVQRQCQELLNDIMLERQINILDSLLSMARTKRNTIYRADYSRCRYQNDVEYRQHHNDLTNRHHVKKYATDPGWRAKVREQQRVYYRRRRQEKGVGEGQALSESGTGNR